MPKKIPKITTSELLLSAIFYLQQKNGVTAKEITKYICEKRGCPQKHMKENVNKALERATVKGIFCRNRGLYRINNGFGLNKMLNKTKGKGRKTSKGSVKPGNQGNPVIEGKTGLQVHFDGEKKKDPNSLSELIDERMNNMYDRVFYPEMSGSQNLEETDDEDFKDTDDDDEDNFFSDEMDEDNGDNEPKTLFFNEKVKNGNIEEIDDMNRASTCCSFNDPFRKDSREEYDENELPGKKPENRRVEEKKRQKEKSRESERDTPDAEREQARENSKETSEGSFRAVRGNDGIASEDENQDNEGYGDQLQDEMEWDCQLNDLECLDRLLGDDYPMEMVERKHVGNDVACDNKNGIKIKMENSRNNFSKEDNPRDIFKANTTNKTTL